MNKKILTNVRTEDLTVNMPMTLDCVGDIRAIIANARRSVVRHVNTVQVLANWLIGRRIVVEEQKGAKRAAYGWHLLEKISKELSAEFGNGFGLANIKNFREFYLQNPEEKQIRYALSSELSWTHFRAPQGSDPHAAQKKAIGKMNEVAHGQGRTVRNLCKMKEAA